MHQPTKSPSRKTEVTHFLRQHSIEKPIRCIFSQILSLKTEEGLWANYIIHLCPLKTQYKGNNVELLKYQNKDTQLSIELVKNLVTENYIFKDQYMET